MCLIVQHRRDVSAHLAQTRLFDDDKGHTGRSEVLLCATIDDVVLANVNRTAEDIRTHIGYQRHITFLLVDLSEFLIVDLGTEDGVVGGNMEIICVLRNLVICRDGVSACSYFDSLTKTFCLLERFLRPNTGIEVRCFLLQEVERNHAELKTCTAAKEQHTITLRHIQQLFHQRFRLVHNGLEILSTVRNLQDGKSFTLKIDHGFSRLFDHFLWQDTRSCIEIVLFHDYFNV